MSNKVSYAGHGSTLTELTDWTSTARAKAIGIRSENDWPYGPNADDVSRALMVRWATASDLRLSRRGCCVEWLNGKNCPGYHENSPVWLDHVTGWNRHGKPAVLVAQPYGLTGESLASLAALDSSPDLHVYIGGTGWYGFGTTFVEVWRQDAYDAMYQERKGA